jgi:transposase
MPVRLVKGKACKLHPEGLLERGTRLVFEPGRPIAHVRAHDLSVPSETLRKCVRQVEANEANAWTS